jgi:hypothetical protein
MRHEIAILTVAVSIACGDLAVAQEFFWRDRRGEPAPDVDARKSLEGFGGWLILTSDGDWEAKWNVPDEQATPSFNEAESLRYGETVVALIFVANPKPDIRGDVNVLCDLKVTRPNGSLSVNQRDLPCLSGKLLGDPLSIRLASHTLKFVGEKGDPLGTWSFDVAVRDIERGVMLSLHTSVELRDDG